MPADVSTARAAPVFNGSQRESISVVIPCRNSARWLGHALDGVARQTLRPREVIVLVDSSTDASETIARRHPIQPRVEITHFRNAAAARNHGVSIAAGRWIAFLDGDDWWTDHHLEHALRLLRAGADVAYFGHFVEYFDRSSRYHRQRPLMAGPARSGLTGADFYHFFLGANPGWPTSGMVIATSRFREVGGFDEAQLRRHDTELIARVVYQRTWSYNPEPVFVYRKEIDDSISSHRAECSYYRFLADEKIARLYGVAPARPRLRRRAEICMSDALRAAEAEPLLRESGRCCLPHLDFLRRCFYRAALSAPGPCRKIQLAAVALKQSLPPHRPRPRVKPSREKPEVVTR